MEPHHPQCVACPIMLPGPGQGCQTVTAIYQITCSAVGCEASYCGMTMGLLRDRIRGHMKQLRHPRGVALVYNHFRTPGHFMRFSVIEALGEATKEEVRRAERQYIADLKPSLNQYANKRHQVPRLPSLPGKPGTYPCGSCSTCSSIKIGLEGVPLCAAPGASCRSNHVIYCISCKRCPDRLYIGSTGMSLSQRMPNHRSHIANDRTHSSRLYFHFQEPGHELTVTVLEQCVPETLKIREAAWIRRLDCTGPRGLNEKSSILVAR